MKKLILILFVFVVTSETCFASDTISMVQAKYYLSKLNEVLTQKKLYIRALASSFSSDNLVDPTDIGEFTIVRKGNCMFQQLKGLVSYSDNEMSVQIDTTERTLVLSKYEQISFANLNYGEWKSSYDFELTTLSADEKLLTINFNPGGMIQKLELSFDTTNFKMSHMNIWYSNDWINNSDWNIRKVEVKYLDMNSNIPGSIDVCRFSDIIQVEKNNGIVVKQENYKNFTLINLLKQ